MSATEEYVKSLCKDRERLCGFVHKSEREAIEKRIEALIQAEQHPAPSRHEDWYEKRDVVVGTDVLKNTPSEDHKGVIGLCVGCTDRDKEIERLEKWLKEDQEVMFEVWKKVHLKCPDLVQWSEVEAKMSRRYPQN